MRSTDNLLIRQLPKVARKRLLDQCDFFELVMSAELNMRGQPLSHAHFPTDGFLSLVIDMEHYPTLEMSMVGHESMVGAEVVLGHAAAPWRAIVQGGGHSWRITAKALRKECAISPALQHLIHTSLLLRLHQQATALACERFHLIAPRLARWLLMSQDRAQSDRFHATHDNMASMLGVRRVGITVAAGELQSHGLIHYRRGEVTVLDHAGLKARACPCYAKDLALHKALFSAKPV
jgi:CRP-like cAMP-binding protein